MHKPVSAPAPMPAIRLLRRPPLWTVGTALLLLVLAVTLWFNIARPIVVLPRITLAPGYVLTDQTGMARTSGDRFGALTLYSFSYAGCAADCPQSAAQIAALRAQIAQRLPAGTALDFVTISLDAANDTPARLSALVAAHDDPSSGVAWHWLTGDPQRIRYVVGGGFELFYREQDGGVAFAPRYVLVDELGMIRARYFTADPAADLLQRDINYLIEERANSQGASRLAYEAAHLFLCYPR